MKQGTVGVFAPSSPFPSERYLAGLDRIRSLGFDVIEGPDLRARTGYLAGDDDTRLASLHALLEDDQVDIVWAARGGYGLHRIVDRIDAALIASAQKPIVGFSDVCALHAIAQAKAGLISVHGPVITQFGTVDEAARAHMAQVLAGDWDGIQYTTDEAALSGGQATGRLLGGCLSVITPMIGSGLLPDFDGAILLLEDVGEVTYRIDRLLTHLALAGVLGSVAGIAVGEFVGCEPRNRDEPTVEAVLAERLGDLQIPIITGLPFGHGHRNLAVPLGTRATLDADAGRLVLHRD